MEEEVLRVEIKIENRYAHCDYFRKSDNITHIRDVGEGGREGGEKYRINCSLVVGFVPGY